MLGSFLGVGACGVITQHSINCQHRSRASMSRASKSRASMTRANKSRVSKSRVLVRIGRAVCGEPVVVLQLFSPMNFLVIPPE